VWIGYPNKQDAKQSGLDFAAFEEMHWKAVSADYNRIARVGKDIRKMLQPGRTVEITSPAGTNVSFKLTTRPIYVNDGVVSQSEATSEQFVDRVATLPGGSVVFTPVEESVRGKVVIPGYKHRGELIRGVQFEFVDGKVRGLRAEQGEATVKDILSQSKALEMLGIVSIGLNPAWKVIEKGDVQFQPGDGAGMVWLTLGYNKILGGEITEVGGHGLPVTNATVRIGGQIVVEDGKLKQ
jgi:leucyl aminopeptidase (aminopeptidase T)